MDTDKPIQFDELKKVIREAFKDVTKGNSVGLHEAIALDDYASPEDQAKAKARDVEEYWWDIPAGNFGTGFNYTNTEGVKFLLPAAMTCGDADAVHWILCHPYDPSAPHSGHKEYINYYRSVNPKKIAEQYGFDQGQVHAIALFFKWWMQEEKVYLYSDPKENKARFERSLKMYGSLPKTHYDLTLEDEAAFFEEECRILRDWLILGDVQV